MFQENSTFTTTETILACWKDEFQAFLCCGERSDGTIAAYLQDVRGFENYFEAENRTVFHPELITSLDLRGYREYSLGTEKTAPKTWNRRRASLKLLCSWAMDAGYVTYDPFQGVRPAEEAESAPHWLPRQEYGRLMRTVERAANTAVTDYSQRIAVRDRAMVALMVWAGLRVAEVVALDCADVEISERKGKVTILRGKRDKKREVPLNSEARRALSDWIGLRGAEGQALFIGKRGERLTTRAVQRRMEKFSQVADIKATPHMLRHTFAKRVLDTGEPLTAVQKLLGHERLETTGIYTRPGWEDLQRAVERIG